MAYCDSGWGYFGAWDPNIPLAPIFPWPTVMCDNGNYPQRCELVLIMIMIKLDVDKKGEKGDSDSHRHGNRLGSTTIKKAQEEKNVLFELSKDGGIQKIILYF